MSVTGIEPLAWTLTRKMKPGVLLGLALSPSVHGPREGLEITLGLCKRVYHVETTMMDAIFLTLSHYGFADCRQV